MILVTGASQGIGLEVARALLTQTTSRVAITGRNDARLQAARRSMDPAHGNRLETLRSDQCDPAAVEALIAWISDQRLPLEGAVLTVGINPRFTSGPQKLHRVDPAILAETIRTNCTHTVLLSAAILARLHARRSGALLWVGSQAPRHGFSGAAIYAGTKAFLSGLARSTANEYGPRGVRVRLLHPGMVDTPRHDDGSRCFAATHGLPFADAAQVGARIAEHFLAADRGPVEVDL